MESTDWLVELCRDVQLEKFAERIRQDLQISRIQHFEYVTAEDLEKVGIARPAAKRLLDAAKKFKGGGWRKNLFNKILPEKSTTKSGKNSPVNAQVQPSLATVAPPENQTCLIPEKEITLKTKLGGGTFGVVMMGEWTTCTGRIVDVACKILKEDPKQTGYFADFIKEVDSMQALNHAHLLKLYGIVLGSQFMMITELAPLGSLRDHLKRNGAKVSIIRLYEYAVQIADGMAYLEQMRFIHRDLACRNILLSSIDKIKIGDFGLMRNLKGDQDCYEMTERHKVPIPWCAPESLTTKVFTHASDTWMYGVTLWEMFSFGKEPWAGFTGKELIQKIEGEGERLEHPSGCSNDLYQLMLQCWHETPELRPTFLALKDFISANMPQLLKLDKLPQAPGNSTALQDNELRMKDVQEGDVIAVIEGRNDYYWWKGQNLRTFEVGLFPRNHCVSTSSKSAKDISAPLRHSFIHTGHFDALGNTWGSPGHIDQMYLKNPAQPEDVLGLPPLPKEPASWLKDLPNRSKTVKQAKQYSYKPLKNDFSSPNEPFPPPLGALNVSPRILENRINFVEPTDDSIYAGESVGYFERDSFDSFSSEALPQQPQEYQNVELSEAPPNRYYSSVADNDGLVSQAAVPSSVPTELEYDDDDEDRDHTYMNVCNIPLPPGIKRESQEVKVAKAPAPPAVKPSTQSNSLQEFIDRQNERFNECKSPTEASLYSEGTNVWGTEYDPPLTDDEGYRIIDSALGDHSSGTYPEERKDRREFPPDVDISKLSDESPPVIAPKPKIEAEFKIPNGFQNNSVPPKPIVNLPYVKQHKQIVPKKKPDVMPLPKPPQQNLVKTTIPTNQIITPQAEGGQWSAFDESPDSPNEEKKIIVNIRNSGSPTRNISQTTGGPPAVIPKLPPPEKKKEMSRSAASNEFKSIDLSVNFSEAPITQMTVNSTTMISPVPNLFSPQFSTAPLPIPAAATPACPLVSLSTSCPAPSSHPLIPAPQTPDEESQDLENRVESYLAMKQRTKLLEERSRKEKEATLKREKELQALKKQQEQQQLQLQQRQEMQRQQEQQLLQQRQQQLQQQQQQQQLKLKMLQEQQQRQQQELQRIQSIKLTSPEPMSLRDCSLQSSHTGFEDSFSSLQVNPRPQSLRQVSQTLPSQKPTVHAAAAAAMNLPSANKSSPPSLSLSNGHQMPLQAHSFVKASTVSSVNLLPAAAAAAASSTKLPTAIRPMVLPSSIPLVPTPVNRDMMSSSSLSNGNFSGSLGDLFGSSRPAITLEDLAKGSSKSYSQTTESFGNNLSRSQETLNKSMPQQTAFVFPLKNSSCNPSKLTAGPSGQNVNIFTNQQPLVPTPVNVLQQQRKTIRSFDELNGAVPSIMACNPTAEVKPFMVRPPPPPPRQPELENFKTSPTHVHQPSNTEILAMQTLLPGSSREECLAAIMANPGNIEGALRQIKLDHLVRLGIAPRQICEVALQNNQWNVDQAASALLDTR